MWIAIAFLVIAIVAAVALRPKAKVTNASAEEVDLSTMTSANTPIPVLFGSRRITNWNVLWYGHKRTEAIKSSGGKK